MSNGYRIECDAYGVDSLVRAANRRLGSQQTAEDAIRDTRAVYGDAAFDSEVERRVAERLAKGAAKANRAATKAPLVNTNGTRRLEGFGSSHAVPSSDELRSMGFGGGTNHAAYTQHVARLQGEVARAQRAHDAVHGAPPFEIVRAGRGATSSEDAVDESRLTPYQRHVRNLQKLNKQ